jgi:hypothetical protein
VIAGLCARGADPLTPLGFLARELLGEIPQLVAKLTRRKT